VARLALRRSEIIARCTRSDGCKHCYPASFLAIIESSPLAQWYWGDYNNKAPEVWPRRDLFNTLYATPPMFMFDKGTWQKEKEHFVESQTPPAKRVA
jgi:hypothetical protein